jgi:hypothetical protein
VTVEERAQAMLEEIPNQKPWEGKEELKAKFAQHLRDQIEECAKIADRHEQAETENAEESRDNQKGLSELGHVFEAAAAKVIGEKIRTLAGPAVDSTEEQVVEIKAEWTEAAPSNQITARERAEKAFQNMHEQAMLEIPQKTWDEWAKEEIERAVVDSEEQATKAERARCLEMLNRCLDVYARNVPPSMNRHAAFTKQTAIEYALMVVFGWSLSEEFREDQMPLPY